MKKLSKIKLQNAVVLENREMKAIYGGSGSEPLCPDDYPYWIRCNNGDGGCCKINDADRCCGDRNN